MLDDLKMIHSRDGQDALGIAEKQWQQLGYDFVVTPQITVHDVATMVYAGMGGSALAALLAQTCLDIRLPFEVVRDYELPPYVDARTLVIAASYSGNTEETLSALEIAEARGAQIAIIAGGGRLVEQATDKGYPLLTLPKAEQPRYAALYNLRALATVTDQAGITTGAIDDLAGAGPFLRQAVESWTPATPTSQNPAKQLALELIGSSPVIYASTLFSSVAYKWKISFNENAKNIAWCGTYPEFNHNEFMGWTSHPIDKPYKVVDLRSSLDHPRIQKRFTISDRLLSGQRPVAHVVELQGQTVLEQMLWGTAFGDFVTLYVALLNGLNPTPVGMIEKFKQEMVV